MAAARAGAGAEAGAGAAEAVGGADVADQLHVDCVRAIASGTSSFAVPPPTGYTKSQARKAVLIVHGYFHRTAADGAGGADSGGGAASAGAGADAAAVAARAGELSVALNADPLDASSRHWRFPVLPPNATPAQLSEPGINPDKHPYGPWQLGVAGPRLLEALDDNDDDAADVTESKEASSSGTTEGNVNVFEFTVPDFGPQRGLQFCLLEAYLKPGLKEVVVYQSADAPDEAALLQQVIYVDQQPHEDVLNKLSVVIKFYVVDKPELIPDEDQRVKLHFYKPNRAVAGIAEVNEPGGRAVGCSQIAAAGGEDVDDNGALPGPSDGDEQPFANPFASAWGWTAGTDAGEGSGLSIKEFVVFEDKSRMVPGFGTTLQRPCVIIRRATLEHKDMATSRLANVLDIHETPRFSFCAMVPKDDKGPTSYQNKASHGSGDAGKGAGDAQEKDGRPARIVPGRGDGSGANSKGGRKKAAGGDAKPDPTKQPNPSDLLKDESNEKKGQDFEVVGETLLHRACLEGDLARLKQLFDGAPANARRREDCCAIINKQTPRQVKTKRVGLQTALHYACNDQHIDSNVGRGDNRGISEEDLAAIVKLLLHNGADAGLRDQLGCTPMLWAAQRGMRKVVAAFRTAAREKLEGGVATSAGAGAAAAATVSSPASWVGPNARNLTPVFVAVFFGHTEVVRELVMGGGAGDSDAAWRPWSRDELGVDRGALPFARVYNLSPRKRISARELIQSNVVSLHDEGLEKLLLEGSSD